MNNLNNTPPHVIERRRAIVSNLVARGGTLREVAARLEKAGEVNPETGQAWNYTTITRDISALREEWREAALADVQEHKTRILAEIEAVKQDAWKAKDLRTVLEAIRSERQLLGLDAPARSETVITEPVKPKLSKEELTERVLELLRSAGRIRETKEDAAFDAATEVEAIEGTG